jgi:hypothetical protein
MNRKAFYAALAFVFMLSLVLAGCASDKSNGKSADSITVDPDGYGCCYSYIPPGDGAPGQFIGDTNYTKSNDCPDTFRTDISCLECLSGKYGTPDPDQLPCPN